MDITPEELVADIQEQLNRAKQILSRLQNVTSTGSGSSMPVNLVGGIAVPPVSSVSAAVSSYTPGVAHVVCRWIEPQNTLNVDRYNVYVIGAELGQTQPVLVASSATSPAVFPVHVDTTRTVKILVQTVLTNGQVMSVLDCPATALSITGPGSGGSGTVTSVGLSMPAEFSVASSPITGSGTIAVTKVSQSANTVYAGPTSGSSASPTFRTVVAADLPIASSSAFGAVKVDGTTITASSGVISAVAGPVGALILLEQHSANNTSTNIDFTSFVSGTYDEYVIELLNLVPATNNIIISMRMSVSGTFDTGSNYSAVGSYLYSGGTGVGLAEDTATQIKLWDGTSSNTNYGFCGSYRLYSPGSTSLYKIVLGQGFAFSGSASKIFGSNVWGVHNSASAVDGIRIFSSSGNIASGIVRIYGIAK